MIRSALLVLITFFSILSNSYAKEIIIKEGDTLSKIANKYQVTVRSLMDSNNIYDGDKLKVGDKISLPSNAKINSKISKIKHKVIAGDTLEKIANLYSIDKNDIITINNIKQPDILILDQILFLPENAKIIQNIKNNADFHIIQEGETIYKLSKIYDISVEDIIEINNIEDPSEVTSGYKIKLIRGTESEFINNSANKSKVAKIPSEDHQLLESENKPVKLDIRQFGPLKIRWSSWRIINGSYVTPAEIKNGRNLFIAINCKSSKINLTKRNGKWSKWLTPKKYFEYNLIEERCENAR